MSNSVKQISVLQNNGTYISQPIGADARNVDIDATHTLADKARSWDSKADSSDLDNYVPVTAKGAANGVATLDAEGKIPSAQIPGGIQPQITIDPVPAEDSANAVSSGGVYSALGDKVDKENGKGLSTNDYTTAEKTKLAGLSNYDDTTLSGRISDIEEVVPTNASTSNKLATMADVGSGGGGTTNYNDLTNKPQIAGTTLSGNKSLSDLGIQAAEIGKGLSTNDYTDAEKTKLAGLNNYDDTTLSGRVVTVENTLSNKVDKDGDKVLSTNDYTDAEKTKLAGIETGAEVNVIESISVNGTPQTITNKNVDLIIGGGGSEYPAMTSADIDRLWELATGKLTIDTWLNKKWYISSPYITLLGFRFWTDGNNIYYSEGSNQYILDKSTNVLKLIEDWNELYIYGEYIWKDGNNIYSSYDSNQYVLDKSTNTWNVKTWNGFTNIDGRYIWTDSDDIYYSNGSNQYVLDKSTDTWNVKTWSGLTDLNGMYIWTDENDIYYSMGSDCQYVLDKSTDTWNVKTWNNSTNFAGIDIWTDGDNIYCEHRTEYDEEEEEWIYKDYVLNKLTDTWEEKSWSGISTGISGNYIWTDGNNIYYSGGNTQRILNKLTNTWEEKTWILPKEYDFYGNYIWIDGDNIYYSYSDTHYILNKTISFWERKTWNGLTNFYVEYIWTDGENIYYSYGSSQYILDKSTSTWNVKTWNGLTNFYRNGIWTDGDNIYCSNGSNQYILDKSTSTWNVKTWNGISELYGKYIWIDGDDIYYSYYDSQYVLDKSTDTWNAKTWSGLTGFNGEYIWTDGNDIYYSNDSSQYILDKSTSTWNVKTWTGLINFYSKYIWKDGNNIYYSSNSNQYKLDN